MSSEAVRLLMKIDRRKQWKGLKDKHAKAIAKSKVNFDQKLGPALDKYQTQVEKLTKVAGNAEITSNMVQGVFETLAPLKTIVTGYHALVKSLEEPTKKELGAMLTAIDGDIESWTELTMNTMGTVATGTTGAEKAAAKAVIGALDEIRTMCVTIVTRGPRAQAAYANQMPNPRPHAAGLVSQLVATARLAGSGSHEVANLANQVVAGSNYEMFKTRAKALLPLIQNVHAAATAFEAKWDIDLDGMTVSGDVDAASFHGNYAQMVQYFDAAIAGLQKLP